MAEQHKFSQDVLEYLPSLKAAAMRMTRNQSDAEDLVQETLLKAYRAYDTFEAGTNLRAWLHCILRNSFINHWRSAKRRPIEIDLVPHWSEDDADLRLDYDTPDYAAESVDSLVVERYTIEREDIVAVLCALPKTRLQPIALIGMDLAYREIAEILDVKMGTVMSRLHRGRYELRDALYDVARKKGLIPVSLAA